MTQRFGYKTAQIGLFLTQLFLCEFRVKRWNKYLKYKPHSQIWPGDLW